MPVPSGLLRGCPATMWQQWGIPSPFEAWIWRIQKTTCSVQVSLNWHRKWAGGIHLTPSSPATSIFLAPTVTSPAAKTPLRNRSRVWATSWPTTAAGACGASSASWAQLREPNWTRTWEICPGAGVIWRLFWANMTGKSPMGSENGITSHCHVDCQRKNAGFWMLLMWKHRKTHPL